MTAKKIVNQSIDYIFQHLNENLSVKEVANQFHYSEFYFSRIFKEEIGESVYAFIKRLKLDQSAIDMKVKSTRSIADIGLDYGYTSSNYSSAFKKHTSLSPAQFRKTLIADSIQNPFSPERLDVFQTYSTYNSNIRIAEIEDIPVLYERIIGSYLEIKTKWSMMMDDYKEYLHSDTLMIERFYNDPSISTGKSCICDLCLSADQNCELENMTTIRGGKFAVYRFEGKITDIFCALQGVFSVWLPKSNYELDERYGLNIYRKTDLANEFVVMDLYIPVK